MSFLPPNHQCQNTEGNTKPGLILSSSTILLAKETRLPLPRLAAELTILFMVALYNRADHYIFTVAVISDLFDAADQSLLQRVLTNELHVLQPLLPDKTNFSYNLRSRHHNRQLIRKTRMWANAQPDGRPAEHRWRPLFNAAKFS